VWRRGIQTATDDSLVRIFMNRKRNERETSTSSDKLDHGVRPICPVLLLHRDSSLLPVRRYRLRVHRRRIRRQRHIALTHQISV
jgi:hypothetical protein